MRAGDTSDLCKSSRMIFVTFFEHCALVHGPEAVPCAPTHSSLSNRPAKARCKVREKYCVACRTSAGAGGQQRQQSGPLQSS